LKHLKSLHTFTDKSGQVVLADHLQQFITAIVIVSATDNCKCLPMKYWYSSLVFVFCMLSLQGQIPITLSFTGSDSVSQSQVSLDSVLIRNLTLNCDTVLYGPAFAFSTTASWPQGLDEVNNPGSVSFTLHQNYPNPFEGITSVDLYNQTAGDFILTLHDETGLRLAEYQNFLGKGVHSFIITSSGNKFLFLTVNNGKHSQTIKMLSTGRVEDCNTIRYFRKDQLNMKNGLKTIENSRFFFYLGNQMRYSAFAHGYNNDTIIDNPASSIAYSFNLSPNSTSPHAVGERYGGGIIFFVDSTGQHGLISDTTDQSSSAEWGCNGTTIGSTSTNMGTGQSNTEVVIAGCSTPGFATRICDDLKKNGYSDWFLPSKDELNQLYLQKTVVGDFADNYYWSSSEVGISHSWAQTFWVGSGYANPHVKYASYYVRCIRDF